MCFINYILIFFYTETIVNNIINIETHGDNNQTENKTYGEKIAEG